MFAIAAMIAAHSTASTAAGHADEELDPLIVTGTRRAERPALDSNVPVDVQTAASLQSVFSPDLDFKLQALVPSWNVRRIPTDDGSIFVRPATLRNLSPDHTLVLVNGRRYHRSGFVDVAGGVRGSQAPDLSQLPSDAFKRVEVLLDGAGAQYGSDAIAGVVNFILDDEPGGRAYAQFGEFERGGGRNLQAGASAGLALGSRGHLNLSAEYVDGDPSNNGIERAQARLIGNQGEPYASAVRAVARDGAVQRFGQPDLQSFKLVVNSGFELGSAKAYAFGNFASQTGVGDFNYRASLDVTGPDADGNIATFSRNGGYDIKNPNGFASSAYNDTWRLIDVYPGGFTPRFGSDTRDFSLAAGVKGASGQLGWDLSASLGSNRIDYWMKESINLSLGPASPLDFPDAGSREQREQSINLDFVYPWHTVFANPVNIGFGLEYRREEFRVRAGDEASWAIGPLRDMSSGSNGFVSALPGTAGAWSSHNTAAYLELDADVTDHVNATLAGRVERYPLFGTRMDWKLATRFELAEWISLRGAAGTGFRAPTPGQQNLYNVAQGPNFNPALARSVNISGQVPATSPIAVLLGGQPLTPEKSANLGVGIVLQPLRGFSATVDAYRIDVDDRFGLSKAFNLGNSTDVTPAQLAFIRNSGEPFATELTDVSFFTNNFDTRTLGVDVVVTWHGRAGPGQLGLEWAGNYNRSKYRDYDPALFSADARLKFLRAVPRVSSQLSGDYAWNQWRFTRRVRHFGEWVYTEPGYQEIGAEDFFDVMAAFTTRNAVSLTVGIENLFDNYSDRVGSVAVRNSGRLYPAGAPYENNGRQYYARITARFYPR